MLPAWLLIALPSFECGSLLTAFSLRSRSKQRELLIYGRPGPRSLAVVDERLKSWAGEPTRAQARLSHWIVRFLRFAADTQAFEYAVQRQVIAAWPIRDQELIDEEVGIIL